jgi:hypothetical protein
VLSLGGMMGGEGQKRNYNGTILLHQESNAILIAWLFYSQAVDFLHQMTE